MAWAELSWGHTLWELGFPILREAAQSREITKWTEERQEPVSLRVYHATCPLLKEKGRVLIMVLGQKA